MKSKDQYRRIISFFSSVVLLAILCISFAVTWNIYYKNKIMFPFYRRGNWVLILINGLITYLFFKVYGASKVGYLKKTDMFYSQIIAIVCSNTVSYFLVCLIARHFVDARPIICLTLVDTVILLLWILISNKVFFKIYPPRRMLIVYGSKDAADLVLKMSQRVDKYMICESIKFTEDIQEIKQTIMKYEGVILCDIPSDYRKELLKYCYSHSTRVYISPELTDIIMRGADDVRLFDTPLLVCRNYGLTFEQKLGKRTFDIVVSAIMLVALLPISLVIAIVIKITDGGPVLYKQERLTYGGKHFYVYKFRSMIQDAEKNGAQLASDNDRRVTPIGKLIRACRCDEIPQLINVLKGDMSIVGPRPERPELCEEYQKTIPDFHFRLHVKAGLTGYAQVIGLYDTTPYDKLKMDLMYIENYSFGWDLQIILMTIKTVFFPPRSNESSSIQLHDLNEKSTKIKEKKKFKNK
jgi:exopolysaccharide biosynthesis polyprenyl glycosylphosphotransferase